MMKAGGTFFCLLTSVLGAEYSVTQFGAIPGETLSPDTLLHNAAAFQRAFDAALPNDKLVVPRDTFSLVGGIRGSNLVNFTFELRGHLVCAHDTSTWPRSSKVQWANGGNVGSTKKQCDAPIVCMT